MNNQGWGISSNISKPWYDIRPQHAESPPNLQALVAQFLEETKLRIEKLERMEVLPMRRKALMVNFYKELEASSEFHHDELTEIEEEWELFEDDSSKEEKTQDLCIDEESQEEVHESRPLEISIVMPPPIKHDHIYEDLMWPTPLPPTLASFLHAHRTHPSKPSLIKAKLIYGVHGQLELWKAFGSVVRSLGAIRGVRRQFCASLVFKEGESIPQHAKNFATAHLWASS
ncbi:hypothetical protein TIFTF001_001627 [Ficus carica]|uniref:Uncharacterized protein n=1 Tax=Ficus carica TaxID=3494 RepID=A0AA87Z0Z7_FICCA|nr:hypothetical protein TIFTF001_001627 [Ficus carica]